MRIPKSPRSRPYERRTAGTRKASMIGVGTRITRLPTDRLLQRDRDAAVEWYSQQKLGLSTKPDADLVLVLGETDDGDARISQMLSADYPLTVA
jgi:hypothetical protein